MAKSQSQESAKHKNSGQSWKTVSLEILLFVALGVFGFSLVTSLFFGGTATILKFAPISLEPQDETDTLASRLYEAVSVRPIPAPSLSPVFMPTVQYWKESILKWAESGSLDPNLVATVMQIESCGNPVAKSGAGASGLFQVMPFHFENQEDPFDPDTNAFRGTAYLAAGLVRSGGHAGLALAGYNGGHSLITRQYKDWPFETQRYYRWGNGIYREASAGWDTSPTLARWLSAGGQSLCDKAQAYIDSLPQ